jgi:hypothetical protein
MIVALDKVLKGRVIVDYWFEPEPKSRVTYLLSNAHEVHN